LILVGGAFNTRRSAADLVPLLSTHFTATKIAVYRPPYRTADEQEVPADYAERVHAAADAGRREEVAEIFFGEAVGTRRVRR